MTTAASIQKKVHITNDFMNSVCRLETSHAKTVSQVNDTSAFIGSISVVDVKLRKRFADIMI
jgi:hypothetical protein